MEHGPVFRGIDPLAREHPLDPSPEVDLAGEFNEQLERLSIDQLLGIVKKQPCSLSCHPVAPSRVGGEQLSKGMTPRQGCPATLQTPPSRQIAH
jgi:hypothetical protein